MYVMWKTNFIFESIVEQQSKKKLVHTIWGV